MKKAGESNGEGGISRRGFLAAVAVPLAVPALVAAAQEEGVLPLNTPGLDHLDIIVPDVEASARFYMRLFDTRLHAQPFQGGFRYFILLGEMNDRREVGYVAIGDARGRGTYIGHFCTSVFDYRRDAQAINTAMTEAFLQAGFGQFPGATGIGGIFADPDGIEIQFLPAPDTLVTAAVPSDLAPSNQGLVVPLAVDHVLLRVSDLARALDYYRILYGPEAGAPDSAGRVWFSFANGSRLILEQAPYEYGSAPRIAHFGIRVEAYDRQAVTAALDELGAELLASPEGANVLRFRDPDGITVELVEG